MLRNFFYLCEYIIVRIVCLFIVFVPRCVLRLISIIVGTIGYYVLPKKRKIALDNLRIAFGKEKTDKERKCIARASMQNLVFVFLEFIHFAKHKEILNKYVFFDEEERSRIEKIASENKGYILMTAHIGSWELLILAAKLLGFRMSIVTRAVKNKYLYDYITYLRSSSGVKIIDKPDAVKTAIRIAQDKGTIGTMIDQRVGESGVVVDFFGQPATVTRFPALMHLKYDFTLYPIFAIRKSSGRYHIVLKDEISAPKHIQDKEARIEYMVKAYTKAVEDVVREYPEQWLWYHRRWRL
ncbi:lysophospholipid acyltransferase family protein [Candidatus Omnitrophota bacterium]